MLQHILRQVSPYIIKLSHAIVQVASASPLQNEQVLEVIYLHHKTLQGHPEKKIALLPSQQISVPYQDISPSYNALQTLHSPWTHFEEEFPEEHLESNYICLHYPCGIKKKYIYLRKR